jgi:N-acetylglucosamine kinase-like BadF-type ATPase
VYFRGNSNWTGIYGLTGAFEGWFSDDDARVPIRAKMRVYVGNVLIELVRWEAEWLDAPSSGIAQRRTMSARRFPALVGIDGGGSRTRAVLVCGKRRVQVEGGTVRIGAVGIGEACERIVNLLAELKLKGELPGFDAVVAGIAGVWLPEERQRVGQVLRWMARERGLVIEQLLVTSDAEIAIEGAFGGAPGVVLIAGTGTIAIGKTARGELVRCGGWGIELDDEGSGAWIGREGLTAVVRSHSMGGDARHS